MNDWTDAWTRAHALALSAPVRGRILGKPEAARLLERCLHDVVERHDLPLLGWVIMPGGLHVIGARGGSLPWTDAVGRVKQAFSHESRVARWRPPGRPWMLDTRVRPLSERDLPQALQALHAMPVKASLCAGELEWPWSSARQAALTGVARRVG